MKGIKAYPSSRSLYLSVPLTDEEIEAAVEAALRSPWCVAERRPLVACGEARINVEKPRDAHVGGEALRETLKSQLSAARDRAVEAVEAVRSGERARLITWLAGLKVGDTVAVEWGSIATGAVVYTDETRVSVEVEGVAPPPSFRRIDGYGVDEKGGAVWHLRLLPLDHPLVVAGLRERRMRELRDRLAAVAAKATDESRLQAALNRLTLDV